MAGRFALDGFETPEALRQRPVKALSGGWQRLMMIARIWVTDPDALLLDEPTNHLDLAKLYQLEAWLNQNTRNMPVIIASHDRDFLDATTNKTLFLRAEQSHIFALPFSKARLALHEADEAMARQQHKDMKEAGQLRRQAAKLNNIAINSGSDLLTVKTKQLKARAAHIENTVVNAHKEHSGAIKLANRGTHAKVLLTLEDVPVTTPAGDLLFNTGEKRVFQSDRIVILGPNGAGKSQLVKKLHRAMTGVEVEGIKPTPSIVLGYVDQALSHLDIDDTPIGIITRQFDLGDQRARAVLAGAGFTLEAQSKPIGVMSFGQRSRLGLLSMRLREPNFYLMDEPTNHVDMGGQEALEAEILAHEATCVLVSHDRSFVRSVGTRFWVIEGKKILEADSPKHFFAQMAALRD